MPLLEVCVESARAAVCAEEGGAHRVELCADLAVGGLTPSAALLRETRESCALPIVVMVRPRAGDFHADERLLCRMERDIERVVDGGADGLVLGVLDEHDEVDGRAVERALGRARGLPITFHRAFDRARDPDAALERLADLGIARVLTSGGAPSALEGADQIARLVGRSAGRVVVMPGGRVRAGNAGELLRRTGALELHSAVASDAALSASLVAELAASMVLAT